MLEERLYRQAFALWSALFELEPFAVDCAEAWRLRLLTERAFARMQRRHKAWLRPARLAARKRKRKRKL